MVKVPRGGQSLARRLLTLLPSWFVTQMLDPSKATAIGPEPTVNVPNPAPSLARSLLTVLSPWFATQMLIPSKATPAGQLPPVNVPSTIPLHPSTLPPA